MAVTLSAVALFLLHLIASVIQNLCGQTKTGKTNGDRDAEDKSRLEDVSRRGVRSLAHEGRVRAF